MCIVVDRDLELLKRLQPRDAASAIGTGSEFTALVNMAVTMTGASAAVLYLDGDHGMVVRGLGECRAGHLKARIERHRLLHAGQAWQDGTVQLSGGRASEDGVTRLAREPAFDQLALMPMRNDEKPVGWLALVDLPPALAGNGQHDTLRLVRDALQDQIRLARRFVDVQCHVQRLHDAVWASVDWMWETDAQNRYVWLSREEVPHPGELQPPRLGDAIPDSAIVDWLGQPAKDGGTLHGMLAYGAPMVRVISKEAGDGGDRFISRCAVPLRWPDGGLKGYRGSARDVTESVRAKAAVWQREQRLRLSTNVLPGAVLRIQGSNWMNARTDEADSRLEQLLGLPASTTPCSLRRLLRSLAREERARMYAQLQSNPPGSGTVQLRLRLQGAQRPVRWLDLSASAARDDNGALYWNAYVVAVPATGLEHPVDGAAAARYGHGDRAAFAAKLGHELKTPLNAIVGLTQLIQMQRMHHDETSQDAWLEQISRTGRHMADTIDTLLAFARAGAGGVQLVVEPVGVVDVLDEAIAILRQSAEQRGIVVRMEASKSVRALCDRRALRQVVLNLLSNAIKYNVERGQVWVNVAVSDQVRVEVRDSGPGVQPAQLARMFEPFERLGAERRNIEGHGLGLAISRELMRAMQGTIAASSGSSGGCTFVVALPPVQAPAAQASPRLPPAIAA